MIRNSLFILFLIVGTFCYSQDYSRVKINTDANGLAFLAERGVTIDHGTYKENIFFISDFSAAEIQTMRDYNYDIEILISDVQKYYVEQNLTPSQSTRKNVACATPGSSSDFTPAIPANFNHGSMGGYLTYNEMLAELDSMAALYPTLITTKAPISTFLTFENRPIYHVMISDNPSIDEVGETKVLYTSIHHAREPMAMMETIFYMWYLLENYSSNEEVQYILNNMKLYFVPCLNPDGYVYNETTNPNGGGMHRKNRHDVGTSNKGVDLNRNYSYEWGTTGTSTNMNSDTYCGTASFSEPETQAMRWLVESNDFKTAFNAHTFGEAILFPISATTTEFADHHDYFQAESNHMSQYNSYAAIKSSTLYPSSGDSDDYMYKVDIGSGQKDTIFAHTPEVGTSFWPAESEIDPICQEMTFSNLVLAHITRVYVVTSDTDPTSIATMIGNFNHDSYRLGLENGSITVSIEPLLNVASVGDPVVHNLAIQQTEAGTISYSLTPGIQFGDEIKYILKTDNGLWVKRDTIVKTYGEITLQAFENGSSANWTGTWGTTTSTFVSDSTSYTDSPVGNYINNTNLTFEYIPQIDLTNASSALITYYAKWDIEANYDFAQFQVSTDNGITWVEQCTNYTVLGTSGGGSVQPNNLPVYEGIQASWVLDEVNMSDYLGQTVKVRFQLKSDGSSTRDGFYFDDLKIMYSEVETIVIPESNFNASANIVCVGQSIAFTDSSSNSPTSWAWDFSDGQTSTDQNPVHTFATSGTYIVNLTVTNAAGSDSYQLNVSIEDCVKIVEDIDKNEISILPNPNNGIFAIKGLELGTDFAIYDLNGKLIMRKAISSEFEEIRLNGVSKGYYYLQITKNGVHRQMNFSIH